MIGNIENAIAKIFAREGARFISLSAPEQMRLFLRADESGAITETNFNLMAGMNV